MVDSPSLALAFAAGFASFVSPCVLPLVPGSLAAVAGFDPAPDARRVDRRVLMRSLVFVGTYSTIFILLGLSATAIGSSLSDHELTLQRISGVAVVAMGVLFVALVFVPRLNREWHPAGLIERAGQGGPLIAGAAFAIAWTPCVGPTLGAILLLAGQSQSTGRGALLLAVYSAGLAVPFLFSAVAFNAAQRAFGFFKRHYAAIQVVSGLILVVMGVLIYNGEFFQLNARVQDALDSLGLDPFRSL